MSTESRLANLESALGVMDEPHQMVEEMRDLLATLLFDECDDESCSKEEYGLIADRFEKLRKEYEEKYEVHRKKRR